MVTIGGLHGKVVEVKETTVVISLSPNTEVEIEKSALVQSASRVGQAYFVTLASFRGGTAKQIEDPTDLIQRIWTNWIT